MQRTHTFAARGWRACLTIGLMLLAAAAPAQELLPVPAATARVIDQTGALGATQRQALEDKLAAFEAASGPQIVMLLVPSTQPEDIAAYATRVGQEWKIGRRDVGDGLLVVVAKNDRRVFIAPAKALEGAVPDLAARQIIDNAIKPAFKAGDYAGGLNLAADQLMSRIRGEHLPALAPRGNGGQGGGSLGWDQLAMFFFVGVPLVGGVLTGLLGRKLGSLVTSGAAGGLAWWLSTSLLVAGGAGLLALIMVGVMGIGAAGRRGGGIGGSPIIFGGGGGWGGGGSGGGGGGFSSGGGGDFGGGGASGNW